MPVQDFLSIDSMIIDVFRTCIIFNSETSPSEKNKHTYCIIYTYIHLKGYFSSNHLNEHNCFCIRFNVISRPQSSGHIQDLAESALQITVLYQRLISNKSQPSFCPWPRISYQNTTLGGTHCHHGVICAFTLDKKNISSVIINAQYVEIAFL